MLPKVPTYYVTILCSAQGGKGERRRASSILLATKWRLLCSYQRPIGLAALPCRGTYCRMRRGCLTQLHSSANYSICSCSSASSETTSRSAPDRMEDCDARARHKTQDSKTAAKPGLQTWESAGLR